MKRCNKCELVLPFEEFHRMTASADGYARRCKKCRRAYYDDNRETVLDRNKTYNKNNREKLAQLNKNRRREIGRRADILRTAAKTRARLLGLTFDLCKARIEFALRLGICERTGIEFCLGDVPDGMTKNPFAPSVDRIDKTQGYTHENVKIVVWAYNSGKGEMSHIDYVEFCRKVVEFNA